ncbi:MAG TPA: transposase [Kofleriaceae bacterium]|nr:transposase [Kofleriaceae bacterium]
MAKARKKHVQLEMELNTWGGKRDGAGRPPRGFRSSERHGLRERFARLTAVHVTLRIVQPFPTLRSREMFFALRKATQAVLGRSDFRIVHVSPEQDHLHLIVEADNHEALAAGVKAFEVSAAQHLNRAASKQLGRRRKGQVFADRYHARLIKSPTQAHHVLNYVLNNWRHHNADEDWGETRFWDVDYMSSAPSFPGWHELAIKPLQYSQLADEYRLCVSRPQTWLLSVGWRKAGPISMYSIPKQR